MKYKPQPPRPAFILFAVLIVVVLLALGAYQFASMTTSETAVTDGYTRAAQARAAAASGIDYAAVMLCPNGLGQPQQSSSSTSSSSQVSSQSQVQAPSNNFTNNPTIFRNIPVGQSDASSTNQYRFSICAPLGPDQTGSSGSPFLLGVTDEGGKINLNAVMQMDPSGKTLHDMLLQLPVPNLTEDIVNCILDWMDSDDQPRTNGAEDEYYQGLNPPYHCKNAPLDSVDELLLVKGVTPQILFGNDRNRNGILDPGEDDGAGQISPGLAAFVTVYSRELNVSSSGQPRIYVNSSNLDQLYQDLVTALGTDLANYILAVRLYGIAQTETTGTINFVASGASSGAARVTGSSGGGGNNKGGGSGGSTFSITLNNSKGTSQVMAVALSAAPAGPAPIQGGKLARNNLDFKSGKPQKITSLFQLVNSSVTIPGSTPNSPGTSYKSPLNDPNSQQQLLPLLIDQVTTTDSPEVTPQININTAPQAVLTALPGIGQTDVEKIMQTRPDPTSSDPPDPAFQTTAWLITKANLPPSTVQKLEKYITARSQVYRVQSLGYGAHGGPVARIEAVIDTNNGAPRIVHWHDLTDLGAGFDLQSLQGQ